MTRYLVSPLAEQDTESIGDHIALDSPHRALTFIAELRSQCNMIAAPQSVSRAPGTGR